ncbi:hypothetical protein N7468_002780 [Penicillium chermesinum]|uniref:ferric-chelate reductase (NADPH) n=1 Tax=Penicillium chermesinum TaxID=63820 RepID=A0A9W9PMB5_9EURO|nr:uncharacterized protein N7468_002780 [Penicillium chermesinum]KAJ5247797.1 hypothetical protein N7468_002780 [Penicillium chermesinum]
MPMVPFLDQPVMLHSSRNPGECTMTPEQCAYKTRYWVYWYEADHRYALPTVAFFMVAIILFAIAHVVSQVSPTRVKASSIWLRPLAFLRYLSYKMWRIAGWNSQSLGVFLLGGAGLIFFFAMTLGPRPYYWPNTREISYGNSPPIATRAGFLALGCMPFLIVLGAKANPITAITGISHEKLNVWHNWVAWAMFVLALVHTFPFIVYHIWKGDLVKQWNDEGIWVTGVVAIIAQAWLTFFSISWIRNRYYEFFKATHYFMAIVFVIFFFLHCDFRMSSWDYFIATGVLYTLCWLYAQCRTWFEHGVRHKATLVAESDYTMKITIKTQMHWAPGQHIFLRFLTCGVHALTAHPFTVCSVPQTNGENELVFYVRQRGGLTARLMGLAKKTPGAQVPVLMDGPYGGFSEGRLEEFDKSLVICGGAGAGLALSLIEEFVRCSNFRQGKEMRVILATRDPGMKAWYTHALEDLATRQSWQKSVPGLSIRIHETFSATPALAPTTDNKVFEVEEGTASKSVHSKESESLVYEIFNVQFFSGRPNLPLAVQNISENAGSSIGTVVCGPASMTHDVSSAASEAQSHILSGKPGFAKELWLHRENFS